MGSMAHFGHATSPPTTVRQAPIMSGMFDITEVDFDVNSTPTAEAAPWEVLAREGVREGFRRLQGPREQAPRPQAHEDREVVGHLRAGGLQH